MTVSEAAARLHLSSSRIYQFIREGRLSAEPVGGRTLLIPEAEVVRLAALARRPGRRPQPPPAGEPG